MNLGVGDGFKFGCGFLMAVLVFQIILIVIGIVFVIVGSLIGVALPTMLR